jgi:hypothetical protein
MATAAPAPGAARSDEAAAGESYPWFSEEVSISSRQLHGIDACTMVLIGPAKTIRCSFAEPRGVGDLLRGMPTS